MTRSPHLLKSKPIQCAAALLLALALLLQPVAALAAPRGQETTLYEDPDGMFSLEIPSAFTEQAALDYETAAEAPLDDLLGSYGHMWGDEAGSSIAVMTFLLDETIADAEVFGQFVEALKESLGGAYLPDVDFEIVDEENLLAVGVLDSDDRYYLAGILADGNAASLIIVDLDYPVYEELSAEIDATLSSFTWDPDAVRIYFGGEPSPDTEPAPELEIVTFDDPDGIFTIEIPDILDSLDVVYEDSGGEPIDGVLASTGRLFFDEEENSVFALFMLLDEEMADADAMLDFALRFQEAAGGNYLPQAELQVVDEENLVVAGEVDIPERYFLIALHGQGDVVAIFSISVDPALMEAQGDAVTNALNSFDWDPEAASAVLSARVAESTAAPTATLTETVPVTDTAPITDTAPVPETAPLTPTEPLTETAPTTATLPATTTEAVAPSGLPGGELEFTRFDHPEGAFTLLYPTGLEPEFTDPEAGGYGYSFNDPTDDSDFAFPPLGVSLLGTGNVLTLEATEPLFNELTDDEFAALIDRIVTEMGDLTVVTDIRNPTDRTAYVVAETGPLFPDESGLRLSLWIEEHEGLLALVTATGRTPVPGEEDTDISPVVFQQALTTFAIDTDAAKASVLASYQAPSGEDATAEAAPAPATPFVDPFGLAQFSVPEALAFRQAVFQDDGFSYEFANDDSQAVFTYSLKEVSPEPFTEDEWAELVELSGGQLIENAPGENPELLSSEIGVPAYAEGNTALVRGQTGRFQVALVLHEIDGVMATSVFFLRNDLWEENEAAIQSLIDTGSTFDPDAVRAATEERADLPFELTGTTMTGSIPANDVEIARKYTFARDDSIVTLVGTDNPELSGEMNHVITWEQRTDLPAAAFVADLEQDSIETADLVVRRDDETTRVAFALTPEYPLPPGNYRGQTYYTDLLFAAHQFVVTPADAPETPSANLSLLLLDPSAPAGAPPIGANVLHSGDVVAERGTGDIPGPSVLRLFWYDPSGALLADAVQTVRSDGGFLANIDYFQFAPTFPWQPGDYSFVLTLDGEPLTSGSVQVIDPGPEVALTEDGGDFLEALPFPAETELAEASEGIDLAVVPTADFPTDAIYGVLRAYVRGQGWTETLPTPGASPDFYYQRWVKDGYELVITPGAEDAADQVWLDYRPVSADEGAPLPLGVPLTAETMAEIGEVAVLPLADQTLRAATYSPDGAWIAALTPDGWLILLDAATLDVKQWWAPEDAGYSTVAFSPDSGELAATMAGKGGYPVQIFKNYNLIWLPVTTLVGHLDVSFGIAYTASDQVLLTTGLDGMAYFWDTHTGIPAIWRASGGILDVDFTPDRELILAALDNRVVEVWGIEEEPIYSFDVLADAEFAAPQISMMPVTNEDGSSEVVVYGGSGPAEWWFVRDDAAELISPVPPDNPDFDAGAAAFSPDAGIVVIGGPSLIAYERVTGGYLGTWEVTDADGQPLDIIRLSFSADGHTLLILTSDGALHLWAAID